MAASSNLHKVMFSLMLPFIHILDCTRAPEAYLSSVLYIW